MSSLEVEDHSKSILIPFLKRLLMRKVHLVRGKMTSIMALFLNKKYSKNSVHQGPKSSIVPSGHIPPHPIPPYAVFMQGLPNQQYGSSRVRHTEIRYGVGQRTCQISRCTATRCDPSLALLQGPAGMGPTVHRMTSLFIGTTNMLRCDVSCIAAKIYASPRR